MSVSCVSFRTRIGRDISETAEGVPVLMRVQDEAHLCAVLWSYLVNSSVPWYEQGETY